MTLGGDAGFAVAPAASVLATPSPTRLREMLIELLLNDVHGPAGGLKEEVGGREAITERYILGTLAPSGEQLSALEDDDFTQAGTDPSEEEGVDPGSKGPSLRLPSSFGMTFVVDGNVDVIEAVAMWGQYRRAPSDQAVKADGSPETVWKRRPMGGQPLVIPLTEGDLPKQVADPAAPQVYVHGRARRRPGGWTVTLFLVNGQQQVKKSKGTRWLFQAQLEVRGRDGSPVFVCNPALDDHRGGPEQAALAMLYRRHLQFATGHGVAVHAEPVLDGEGRPTGRAVSIRTASTPTYEVPRTDAPAPSEIGLLADLELDMSALADLPQAGLEAALRPLTRAYGAWIATRRKDLTGSDLAGHRDAGEAALAECDRALGRIEASIRLLGEDNGAFEAFRFMNRTMHLQRIHTIYVGRQKAVDGGGVSLAEIDEPRNRSWRPFQLAFILSNLPALSLLDHPDRSAEPSAAADLLWFPTGGGKTEAYLGLTAFTLAIRRLQGVVAGRDGESGVAVLMRYTLRLLTLQQFQRATTLICACERLRQDALAAGDSRWGHEPFRIGLWVGQRMTPNWTDESAEAVALAHGQAPSRAKVGGKGSPHQLTSCPWCGSSIDAGTNIRVETTKQGIGRTLVYCGDPGGTCPFSRRNAPHEGLPVVVVDEEIYRRLPSLLIATVDKFALMPWKGAIQTLFGQVEGRCERHGFVAPEIEDSPTHPARNGLPKARTLPAGPLRPPDLIIQDELHLISGPLGSLVGLYETAVDELATWEVAGKRVRPKVVASTATIQRAPDQVKRLFLRAVNVFPPSGLEASDSFFARQSPVSEDNPGRLYLGVCARGTRLKAALIRVYTALLAASQKLYDEYGEAADPYMTLVGYFGALRELGGMRRLVDDDVQQRLRWMTDRGLARRQKPNVEELTSRKSSSEIPQILDRMSLTMAQRDKEKRQYPIDVLLATNMISVGVDVSRLGLMVVTGQPKNTAEYIQATSRVGREKQGPGLVVTVFNWTRPRDLSHYERFEHYHATLYRQVEALSVTPFAPRAIDRGLSALMVSLLRLGGMEFNENGQAGRVTTATPAALSAIERIVARAADVTDDPEVAERVQRELGNRLKHWTSMAQTGGGAELSYEKKRDDVSIGLLSRPTGEGWQTFTCAQSLRDVEPSIGLIFQEWAMDDRAESRVQVLAPTGPIESDGADGIEETQA